MMKHLNKVNRPLLTEVPTQKKLSGEEVKDAMAKGIKLIDTRNKVDFAAGYVPESINIQGNNAFATWMGWFVNYQESFILVATDDQIEDLTRKLNRIGLDNVLGYVSDVKSLGVELKQSNIIGIDEFKSYLDREDTQIIDLRGVAEFNTGHVAGADNIFVGTILQNLDKVSKDKQVVIHCQGGDRAAIGHSVLEKAGFQNIKNYSEGMNEWVNSGNPIETTVVEAAVC
jgi:hydroxyacylglutathione hydrolase